MEEPLPLKLHMGGRTAQDVAWTSSGILILVSDKFVDVLEKNALTGWQTFPVEVQGVDRNYHGFSVIGRCGELEPIGEVVVVETMAGPEPRRKGLIFEQESWDGSDFFLSRDGTARKFATAQARDALLAAGITNAAFLPTTEVERD